MQRLKLFLIILAFFYPSVASANSVIYLKNGGRLTTSAYWQEGEMLLFYIAGGVMGIEQASVLKIVEEKSTPSGETDAIIRTAPDKARISPSSPPPAIGQKKTSTSKTAAVKPMKEPLDLAPYRQRHRELKAGLDDTVERLRRATRNQDDRAKESAREEMRKISGKIYDLTDEVKSKNDGSLPPDWWN
jgi:hypothetical protein